MHTQYLTSAHAHTCIVILATVISQIGRLMDRILHPVTTVGTVNVVLHPKSDMWVNICRIKRRLYHGFMEASVELSQKWSYISLSYITLLHQDTAKYASIIYVFVLVLFFVCWKGLSLWTAGGGRGWWWALQDALLAPKIITLVSVFQLLLYSLIV